MAAKQAAMAAMAIAMLIAPGELCAQRPGGRPAYGDKRHKMPGKMAPRRQTQLEVLQRMTPEQRRRLLDNLPPERKRMMENRLLQFDRMSPEERRRARRTLEDFQNLPEERREKVRVLFGAFNQMPPRRRMVLREEIRTLGQLDEEARRERMSGEDYRNRYSAEEQDWLAELSDALHAK